MNSRRSTGRASDQQCDRAAELGDLPPYAGGGSLLGRKHRAEAGLCSAAPCGRHLVGQQEVHEHVILRGGAGGRLPDHLTSFLPENPNLFAHNS